MTRPGPRVLLASGWIALGVLYLATASPWLLGGDSAEFALIAAEGGIPHPSGYPLFVLIQRAFSWFPLAAEHRAALVCGLIGFVAIGVFFHMARAWGAGLSAAAFATAWFALSPRAWVAFTYPEVFGLNAALASFLALVCAPEPDVVPSWRHGDRRLAAIGIASGLGFANHLSFCLLVPLGIFGLIQGLREAKHHAKALASMIGLAGFGLLPYLYLRHAAWSLNGRWAWGDLRTWRSLFAHIVRVDYGTFQLGNNAHAGAEFANVKAFAVACAADTFGLGLVIAAIGLVALMCAKRGASIALLATIVLAGPVFIGRFNLMPRGVSGYIVSRFYLLPEIFVFLAIALGIDAILARTAERLRSGVRVAFASALLVAQGAMAFVHVREHNAPYVDDHVRDALATPEPRAVVFGAGDSMFFGVLFAQRVWHLRDDVIYGDVFMFGADWYLERFEHRLGMKLHQAENGLLSLPDVCDQILATGRPVYLSTFNDVVESAVSTHPNYPHGTMIRILPRGARPPSLAEQERENERLFETFRASRRPPLADGHNWHGDALANYRRTWHALAEDYLAAGDREGAARCESRAARYTPLDSERERP